LAGKASEKSEIMFQPTQTKANFIVDDIEASVSLLTGTYPDLFMLFSDLETSSVFTVKLSDLQAATNQAQAVMGGLNNRLELSLQEDVLHLSTVSEQGSFEADITGTTDGSQVSVTVNNVLLQEALRTFTGEDVSIHYFKPQAPVMLSPTANPHLRHYIMPFA